MQLIFETVLNGLQFGIFLFLVAAGLTLVFGIMNLVNLAHGSMFMMGAYYAAATYQATGSFLLAIVVAVPGALVTGILIEVIALRTLYSRDHLDQVLATFGLILFFNQFVLRAFGAESMEYTLPNTIDFPLEMSANWVIALGAAIVTTGGVLLLRSLGLLGGVGQRGTLGLFTRASTSGRLFGAILLLAIGLVFMRGVYTLPPTMVLAVLVAFATRLAWGWILVLSGLALVATLIISIAAGTGISLTYPSYRLIVIAAGLLVAATLYVVITKSRIGMLIRAGASNRPMVGALGVNIKLLYTLVFGIGAAMAGFAGVMIGPIESVESGMGEGKLILAFVVIVIGGIGSIRGAFIASIIVGLVEVVGRVFIPDILKAYLEAEFAQTAGPALASMIIYVLMAAVLFFKPEGLFPARTG